MPTRKVAELVERLHRVVRPGGGDAEVCDGELLSRFLERGEPDALAALVQRHGPMVWGVCRRLLSHHDAEDAFQATFLVLVRSAASIKSKRTVGNWLYGVARQVSSQARRASVRRTAREFQVRTLPETTTHQHEELWADVGPVLDEELSRLPNNYRAVIVLCDLEDRTRPQVARQLGVPEGTVGGWLARARAMLAKRLTQRGIALTGGVLGTLLLERSLLGHAPNSLVKSTIQAASQLAAGTTATRSAVSGALALSEGVVKTMHMNKLKALVAAVLFFSLVAAGIPLLVTHSVAGQEGKQVRGGKPAHSPSDPGQPAERKPTEDNKDAPSTRPGVPKPQPATKDFNAMQGNWIVVGLEQEGKVVKPDVLEYLKMRVLIRHNKMTELSTTPDGQDISDGETTFTLDETTSPKHFNGKTDAGELLGIYAFEDGKLKICIDHDGRLRPTSLKPEPKSHQRLMILQKQEATSRAPGGKGVPLRARLKEVDSKRSVITVDSVGIGFSDTNNQVAPFRIQNLPISTDATITDGKKKLKLSDLNKEDLLLLQVESVADQNALVVTGIQIEHEAK